MGNYITETQVRAEGVPASVKKSRIDARIVKWEAIIEQITKNIFRPITPGELIFDGNDAQLMHFSLPLISVTSIKVNDQTTVLAVDEFRAFTGRQMPQDDRRNPKIKLTPVQSSIFRDTQAVFIKGLNQAITATWGFTEPDGSTPQPIKDVLVELVTLDLAGYFTKSTSGTSIPLTSVRRERTDGHEIEYHHVENPRIVWSMIPKHLVDVLALYRGPWLMRSPEPPQLLPSVLLGVSIFRD